MKFERTFQAWKKFLAKKNYEFKLRKKIKKFFDQAFLFIQSKKKDKKKKLHF